MVSSFAVSAVASGWSGALVVSGSRACPPARAAEFASFAVGLAVSRGWGVLVGDARGVDASVVSAAAAAGIPLAVFGAAAAGRLRLSVPVACSAVLVPGGSVRGSAWALRDRALVAAALAAPVAGFAGCVFGEGRGTRLTARFAVRAGLPGLLVFSGGWFRWSAGERPVWVAPVD